MEGDSLLAAFENEGALQSYRRALSEGESYDLLFKAGGAALLVGFETEDDREGYFDEAAEYSERLTEGYPDEPGSWTLMAATIGRLAQFEGPREKARVARDVYRFVNEALDRDSTYAYAYIVAGILEREVSQLGWLKRLAASTLLGGLPPATLEKSRTHLARAVQLAPDLIPARWEFSKTCLAMERPHEALVHLQYIEQLTPANSDDARLKLKAADFASDLHRRLNGGK